MDKKQTLLEHIEELRIRILKSAIFIILASFIAYVFVDQILIVIVRPVKNLIFIAPQEAFTSKLALSIFLGLILASPFILFQIWRFIFSGLKKKEKRYLVIFAPLSFLFFIAGAFFGYYIIVPIGINFLLGFATDFLKPMIAIASYINFIGILTIAFGVVFELPLAILCLTRLGLVTPQVLSTKRRYAIALIFITAAILTPPDVATQFLMAIPLIILYEIGIFFSRFSLPARRRGP